MTTDQLNAIPLYSVVSYQGKQVYLLKVKDGQGILFDQALGWISYPLPASDITLISTFRPQNPTNDIATTPLFVSVSVDGKSGVLIDKREHYNEFTGKTWYSGLVWFPDTEDAQFYSQDQITITGTQPGTTQPGTTQPEQAQISGKWLLIGLAGLAIFYLMTKEKE